ncbi:MAG: V-type ATP synthase subunit I [Bacillota bacterium]|jgi:V/A-type H+-transporting ATPase subunit I
MAVARMKKVTIFASQDYKEEILEKIRDLEMMEVTETQEALGSVEPQQVPPDVQENIARLAYLSSYFMKYNAPRKSFVDMFTGKKPEVSLETLRDTIQNYDIDSVYLKAKEHEERLKAITQEEGRIASLREQLLPWAALDLPLRRLGATASTGNLLAIVGASSWEGHREGIQGRPVHFETVWEDRGRIGLWVLYLEDEHEWVRSLISSAGGTVVNLDATTVASGTDTVKDAIRGLDEALETLCAEREQIEDEDKEMSGDLLNVLALWDYYQDKRNLVEVLGTVGKTVYTLVITGYVKAKDMPRFQQAFSDMGEVAITHEDPGPDDDVPVYLENHPIIRPFETITNIFGFPKYTEIDPTPVLAPFFWVFFGICLGDAVYGIVLALACWAFLKTQKLTEGGQKLVRLLMYSGISTIFMGALMGSWLADLPSVFFGGTIIERFAQSVAILDPIGDPLTLLVISFVLGILQVWVGIIVNMWGLIRSDQVFEGVISQGSWVLFLGGAVGWIATKAGLFSSPIPLYITGVGALMVMYSASRGQKNILLKPFSGLYGLYGVVGYFSDTMSYSRLLALGLASAVIGVVVNKVAELVATMIPVVGWVFVPIILLGGHVFNLAINVLGSFIHSGRLQFVEFFTKFFEGGGKPFRPLKRVSDNVWLS